MSKHSLINLREILPETASDFFAPWNDWFRKNNFFAHTTVPALNISDEKDHYKVTVAAPGLEKSDFEVEVDNNVLTISAASEKEKEEDKTKYRRREYSYNSFSRSFTLPSDVNAGKIDAGYNNGILTLDLPKEDKAKNGSEKKIIVK